ncbi:hypothetical protein G6F48_000617 [Rhizopus delemar]|nr:hypothetical protein G6F48_000617 [Rhizopus delemar]
MGDSFFGFDTSLPPLSEEELRGLTDKNKQDTISTYDHADVYDFATLRDELGAHEEELLEEGDQLADQLIEDGDNNNDITFADAPVDKDFDFSGNTQRFSANYKDPSSFTEEEAFFANRRLKDDSVNSGSFRNIWASHSTSTTRQPNVGRNFGEASPIASSKSIWGNFSSGLSTPDNNGFSPLVSGHNNLSPFSNRQHTPQQQHQQPFIDGMSPSTSTGYVQQNRVKPMTLEDLEADMQRQAAHRYRQNEPAAKVMSLAELEATLASNRPAQAAGMPPAPPFGYPQPDPMQILAMKQQQELKEQQLSIARELKRRENYRKSQYDGLMTQNDKDFVNRIQLSQLASGDPYADDFYYQVYTSLRQRAGLPTATQVTNERGTRGRRDESMMQRMQQQLQRIVNDAKRRPKQTGVSLEGALGKITSLTVRNPRQVLQVANAHAVHTEALDETADAATMDSRQVLKLTEDMYTIVLEIEQMRRQGPPQVSEEEEEVENYHQKFAEKVEKLWKSLRLAETFLISLLSTAKGKKLIPRIVRQLSNDQNLKVLRTLVTHFTKLQVCRCVIYPGTAVAHVEEAQKQMFVTFDEMELFMNATAPPLLAMIAEAPISVINGLLQLLLEKNDIIRVAQTKPGLAFLTMLLSRAEILKQGGGALQGLAQPTAEEMAHWQELYTVLFNMLKGRYLGVFPSLYYLVPINPSTSMLQISLAVDDMYVWQFLAAIAVGASMEQQHILVTEVRDRVMENIVLAKSNRLPLDQANHRIANVNLFLHALGLDASQVSVPM